MFYPNLPTSNLNLVYVLPKLIYVLAKLGLGLKWGSLCFCLIGLFKYILCLSARRRRASCERDSSGGAQSAPLVRAAPYQAHEVRAGLSEANRE